MILADLIPDFVMLALLGVAAQAIAGRRGIASRVAARFAGGDRSRRTTGWAAGTAAAYALPSLAALLVLGRVGGVTRLPPEFAALAHRWDMPARVGPDTLEIATNLAAGSAIGLGLLVLLARIGRLPGKRLYRPVAAARSGQEAPAAALLAVSAGISEELFFRLALPLAAALAMGSALAGVVVGTIVFGMAHRYQGAIGVILTMLAGAGLAWLYLWTGALWFVMLIHTVVDVHALVLRPWIAGWRQ